MRITKRKSILPVH